MVCFRVCVSSGQADQRATSFTTAMKTSTLAKLRLVAALSQHHHPFHGLPWTHSRTSCSPKCGLLCKVKMNDTNNVYSLNAFMLFGFYLISFLIILDDNLTRPCVLYVPLQFRLCTKPMTTMWLWSEQEWPSTRLLLLLNSWRKVHGENRETKW